MGVFRTFLFAPGNHARRSEKAFTVGADAVILDLEDACPVSLKIETRDSVIVALSKPRPCLGYVRVNPLSTEFGFRDILAVVRPCVDGIIVPKVESADELKTAEWLVAQVEREQGLPPNAIDIVPIIETGRGLAALDAIARAGTRVRRIAFGAGDFTLDMNLAWSRDEAEFHYYRSTFVMTSRAAGLEPPIDTVWIRLQDEDGFAASAARGRALGFQGKLCIHPGQIAVANAAFSPSAEQVAWADRIIEAFAAAEASGSASFTVDGQFVDYPTVHQARRIIDAHRQITASA